MTTRSRPSLRSSERGSVMIVALIFAAVIGIALASYISLGRSAITLSNRALYNNAAINLAEQGLEEAMYSINQYVADPGYGWSDARGSWTISGTEAKRKWVDVELSQNARGIFRVHIIGFNSVAPIIRSRATITLAGTDEPPIEKWVEITLGRTSRFSNGLVAKNAIVFNGTNTTVDSWNSDPDNNSATAPIRFSNAVRNDQGSVGSISVGVDAVLVKNADIWGYVSTGGDDPTDNVGNGGSVLGETSVNDGSWTKSTVDPARISTKFSASFDDVSAPVKTESGTTITYKAIPTINNTLTLPSSDPTYSTAPHDDGYYYYTTDNINFTNKTLTISDKVIIKLTDTSTGVDIGGGSGQLSIASGGMLQVYTPGSIKIAGQGVSNGTDGADAGSDISNSEMGQPIQCQFFGTKTSGSQSIDIAGNGALSATVYAPFGNVKINGNGSVAGSIVANNITMVGNAAFHYDESLAQDSAGNPFRISKWKELTSQAERATHQAQLSF